MERYQKLEKIGEGTYGKVYKARDALSGRLVALKSTQIDREDKGVPSTALREISLLQTLSDSAYVVRLLSVELVVRNSRPRLYLVFEYLDSDLKKFIDEQSSGIPLSDIKRLMYQLCKGIAYCHGHGVMHRDLKPQNLLLDNKNRLLKIADFGLSRAFSIPLKNYTHEVVSLCYRAPEVLLGATHYSTPVDIWSIGCIFGFPLFPGDSELQQLLHIFRLLGTPDENVWPGISKLRDWHEYPRWKPQKLSEIVPDIGMDGVDLLSKMLQYDPPKRITAKEALEHPFFDDLDKSQV
ncbi:hypothetical protein KP509_23G069800 [Ceratopteris richardii]|uniref:cyclin-dependent kinase n=1 Tax=Ceratopteris richardii TaxID=49495 RepID=A0A8T2S0T9_CERRI|nr:hypothetical protein KP509_23G069800 [Ceratopteris richardii]